MHQKPVKQDGKDKKNSYKVNIHTFTFKYSTVITVAKTGKVIYYNTEQFHRFN